MGPRLVKVALEWFFQSVIASTSSLAIILRSRPYGDFDKIVTFLSKETGKLTGIAKGAKNSRKTIRQLPGSTNWCSGLFSRSTPYRIGVYGELRFAEASRRIE